MTRYLLDTNIVSDLIRNPRGRVAAHIAHVGEANVCTSVIVAAELRYGCAKSGSKRLSAAVESLLGELAVLALEGPAAAEYGAIRAGLERRGTPIGGNDLLIAAHALAIDATVVTANMDEFARVEGLKVQNWLA
ncbi:MULTISPECIES: type II toxin-antitoxin system VapC family toxin [Methylosinus]|uniref:Ribonuclease VapC n=1 Tax=Methylosinus trichosporium (strain ATCC 35070 / NCIMB 11131 / UNIQEM 75 / OB3b) TaxID=595536 RepID=A0A2D2D6G3_METT3|nr:MULTISPECIES: type II toxin-antitoxin system VapC family toxin [Methylosinus]ATQ70563.1 PIN domain-containing protein [Methylosinus trichosporium OB3b]OBS50659.1 transcriptional regulator [Methylosinus sp. 3S-1]